MKKAILSALVLTLSVSTSSYAFLDGMGMAGQNAVDRARDAYSRSQQQSSGDFQITIHKVNNVAYKDNRTGAFIFTTDCFADAYNETVTVHQGGGKSYRATGTLTFSSGQVCDIVQITKM